MPKTWPSGTVIPVTYSQSAWVPFPLTGVLKKLTVPLLLFGLLAETLTLTSLFGLFL